MSDCNIKKFSDYINLLTKYDNKHPEPSICTQQFPDLKGNPTDRYRFWPIGDLEQEFTKLAKRNEEDRYSVSVAVNEMGEDFRPLHAEVFEKSAAEVSRIRAFVVDIDTYLNSSVIESLMEVLQPTFVVVSSQRLAKCKSHWYFLLSPCDEEFEEYLIQSYNTLQKSLAYCTDLLIKEITDGIVPEDGWCDRGINLATAMRAPGTLHQKNSKYVSVIKLIDCEGPEVSEDNLKEFLERFGVTKAILENFTHRSARRQTDSTYGSETGYAGAGEGGRNKSLSDWVYDFLVDHGLVESHCLALAKYENLEKNDPPLDDEEVEAIVASAFKKFRMHSSDKLVAQVESGNVKSIRRRFELEAEKIKALKEALIDPEEAGYHASRVVELIDTYDYTDKKYEHILSDESVRRRVFDGYGDRLLHTDATGVLAYDEKVGVWEDGLGKKLAWQAVGEVVRNMKHEKPVQEQFPPRLDGSEDAETKAAKREVGFDQEDLGKFITLKLKTGNINTIAASLEKDPSFNRDQEELDSEVDLLNTANGILELTTGKLLPHDPAALFTAQTLGRVNVKRIDRLTDMQDYEEWKADKWSSMVYTYSDNDLEMARFLQVLFGVSLYGEVKIQKAPMLLGAGANCKSTLLDLMANTLGSFAANVPQNFITLQKFGRDNQYFDKLSQLRNKRFVIVEDMAEDAEYDESVIKNLTNGGKITSRALRESNFDAVTRFMMFLQSNHKPRIRGTDDGIWRRMLAIWFTYKIPSHLKDDAYKMEACRDMQLTDNIMDWLAGGALRFAKEGLIIPSAVERVTDEYKREQQPLHAFLEDNFVVERDKSRAIESAALFDIYAYWTYVTQPESCGLPRNAQSLGRKLRPSIEKIYNIEYKPSEFRSANSRLLPITPKDNSFMQEFNSSAIQDMLRSIKKEQFNVIAMHDPAKKFKAVK